MLCILIKLLYPRNRKEKELLESNARQNKVNNTVANSLPENEVILLTLLISARYIPYTDLLKNLCFYTGTIIEFLPNRRLYRPTISDA